MTVQVLEAFALMLLGLHTTPETNICATKLKLADWEEPFNVAVMVADWFVVIVATVALNVAEVLLAGTVTDAPTGRAVLLLDSPTVLPPLGAA